MNALKAHAILNDGLIGKLCLLQNLNPLMVNANKQESSTEYKENIDVWYI